MTWQPKRMETTHPVWWNIYNFFFDQFQVFGRVLFVLKCSALRSPQTASVLKWPALTWASSDAKGAKEKWKANYRAMAKHLNGWAWRSACHSAWMLAWVVHGLVHDGNKTLHNSVWAWMLSHSCCDSGPMKVHRKWIHKVALLAQSNKEPKLS